MIARRLPSILLLLYLVFLVYGSLFPFDFTHDPQALARFLDHPIPRRLSLPDVVANVLLGVPFGVLMVWSGLAGVPPLVRFARVVAADAAVAFAVELGQLFVPSRLSSVADVVAQVTGSVVGLLVMQALLVGREDPLGPRLAATFRRRPRLAMLLVLVTVLAADALYPYAITLDVSTVWHNVKNGQWRPLGSLGRAFWPDLLVEKLLAYGAVAALGRTALDELPPALSGALAWGGATLLATGLEGAKVLIVGRAPNVDTIWLAALGGLWGVTVLPALGRVGAVRRHTPALLVAAAAALLAYEELTPFTFVGLVALPARLSRVEWIPFASYYGADFQSALFDFGKKLMLGGGLGAAMRRVSPRPRLILVAGLATILEAMQVAQPTHIASTTDVLLLYAGAVVGAHLVAWSEEGRSD